MFKKSVVTITALLIFFSLHAQGRIFDNLNSVRIRSSEHFNYLYNAEHEDFIPELAGIAEAEYAILRDIMKTEPPAKVNIVLTDQADIPNGFASVYIDEYINLYMTNPDAQFIVKHREWIEFVLLHEMTHIFNLSSLNPSCLKYLNNNIFFLPNATVPMYVMEGYTVYNESTIMSGRLYDTNFESFLRTMILDNDIQPLDRANTYVNRHWPYATLPYLYGGYIFDRYAREGKDLTVFNNVSCLSCLPVGSMLPDISIGMRTGSLPTATLKRAMEDARERSEILISRNIPDKRINLTNTGNFNALPVFSENTLYYVKHYDNKSQRFVRDNGKITELFSTSSPLSVFADDQRHSLLYEHLDYYENTNTLFTIMEYRNESVKELAGTQRGMYPVSLNDTLYFVRNNWSSQFIIYYDLKSGTCIDSFTFNHDWRYYDLDINDSGDIALSVWKPGGYTDIAVFNVHDRDLAFLTGDRHADFMPQWSENGIYYISDFEGLNKVYEYSFSDSMSHAVYTTLYQVVAYAVDENNGKIYVQDLSSEGYDIYSAALSYGNGIMRECEPYEAYEPIGSEAALSESRPYLFPAFSGPGVYYFIPWLSYTYFSDDDPMTADLGILSGTYVNSDVTSSYSVNVNVNDFRMRTHYDSITGIADSVQYIYNAGLNYTISSTYPDISIGAVFANANSSTMPDAGEISVGVSVDRIKSFDYANISAFITGAFEDTIEEYGFSGSALYSNTDGGIATVLPTSGFTASLGTYEKMRRGSGNFLAGINANLTLFYPLLSRGSLFLSSSVYWANSDSISLSPANPDDLYSNWRLRAYDIGMNGIDTTMWFNNLIAVKPGFEIPIVIINRGFPIPFLASLPVVFDYISWKTSMTYFYSQGNSFNDYIIESGIYLKVMASQLFPIKAGINAYYIPSEDKYGINLSIKM